MTKKQVPITEQRTQNQRYFPERVVMVVSGSPSGGQSSNGQCHLSPTGAHWWLIDGPSCEVSIGVCKYCGAVREFLNRFEERGKKR